MIIESSIKLKLGARVLVKQLVYSGSELLKESELFGHVVRPSTCEEYALESHDSCSSKEECSARNAKYYYYEVRLEQNDKA